VIFRVHELPIETQLRSVVCELRRCCNHPLLVGDNYNLEMNEQLVSSCGKLSVLDKMLAELKKDAHKVLFSFVLYTLRSCVYLYPYIHN